VPSSTPDPRRAARRELLRAFGGLALGPWRLMGFALERDAIRAGVRRDLDAPLPTPDGPEVQPRLDEQLRLFISCGETSSEVHAVRLVAETNGLLAQAGAPPPRWCGLGGEALRAAGVEVLADPTSKATMGGQGVLAELGYWRGVLTSAATGLREQQPHAFVGVDAPALHLPLARIARRYGVPTVHHVAPQYWAWAPWRVHAYRRAVTRALCILPFEPSWFARHGVDARYVGHPQADVLAQLEPAPGEADRGTIVLLPGSRAGEIEHVLPVMLRAVRAAGARLGQPPVRVLQRTEEHAPRIREMLAEDGGDAELVVGDPHPQLAHARAALATSGTVLLDLLHHRLPTVVLYALRGALRSRVAGWLVTVPWFAGPNLLAREQVLPEVAFPAERPPDPEQLGALLVRAFQDDEWRRTCRRGLERAARRLGPAGTGARAARHLLQVAGGV
jgi:lipid-A-disaccharide synthase